MRRLALLLCAALLAVGISVPRPAHANGGGSVDVAPSAVARCDPGDCWVRVREFDISNRGHTWVKEYHTNLGFWQTFAENVPFTIAGNESEDSSGVRYAVDNTNALRCWNGSWQNAGTGFDVDAKRATLGADQVPGGARWAAASYPTGGADQVMLVSLPGTPCFSGANLTPLGGGTNWSPGLAIMSDGAHPALTGTLGDVWQYSPSGGGWGSIGGGSTGAPSAVSWDHGNRLDIFVRGTDGALWHRGFANGWGAWESLGGGLAAGPGCASWAANRLDCFVIGTDGVSVWHLPFNGSYWGPWENLG